MYLSQRASTLACAKIRRSGDYHFLRLSLYPEFRLQMSRDCWMDMKIRLVMIIVFFLFHASASLSQTAAQQNHPQPIPRPRVIVFVHGLHGSRESWRASNGAW